MNPKKKAYVISVLRRASYRWKPRYTALNNARVERGKYKCNSCQNIVGRKEIQMDHVHPIIPTTGWVSWESYIDNLLSDNVKDWQALCRTCHASKTDAENVERKAHRKNKKSS